MGSEHSVGKPLDGSSAFELTTRSNVQVSLLNGGPTGTIVAYPLVFLGVLAQTLVMAEMASMYVGSIFLIDYL